MYLCEQSTAQRAINRSTSRWSTSSSGPRLRRSQKSFFLGLYFSQPPISRFPRHVASLRAHKCWSRTSPTMSGGSSLTDGRFQIFGLDHTAALVQELFFPRRSSLSFLFEPQQHCYVHRVPRTCYDLLHEGESISSLSFSLKHVRIELLCRTCV